MLEAGEGLTGHVDMSIEEDGLNAASCCQHATNIKGGLARMRLLELEVLR